MRPRSKKPATRWTGRDNWRIPRRVGDSSIEWYAAPGRVMYDCDLYPEPTNRDGRAGLFWCIGVVEDGRWWANEDATPTLHYFGSEEDARAFVEVMIRLDM
jgi:hypothetical protein